MDEGTASTPKRILPTDYGRLVAARAKNSNAKLYTELHAFIDETRRDFKDKVPFGRWLGQCKDFTPHELRVIRDSLSDSRARNRGALFFYKLVEARKAKRKAEAKQLTI